MSRTGRLTPALARALSADRFRTYQRECGTPDEALELYEWNATVSAAVMHLTGMVEVCVRNAMDEQLAQWHVSRGRPGEWWDSGLLDARGTRDVAEARRRAGKTQAHGRVVAELSMGFWRYLTAKRYLTTFWIPALQHGFTTPSTSAEEQRTWVEARLRDLHFVRNRAAHHEPLLRRDLSRDVVMAFELADAVHPDVGTWVRAQCTVHTVLKQRPAR